MKTFSTYLFLLIYCQTHAQSLCLSNSFTKGDFDLSTANLCLPQKLTVADKSGATNIKYVFNYQGENLDEVTAIATSQLSFDYTALVNKPESFTVLQIGFVNGKAAIACKNLTVRPSNVAVFSYTACTNKAEVFVNIPANSFNDFDSYEIKINSTIAKVVPSELPYQSGFFVLPPAQLRVTGIYNDPSKGCGLPVLSTRIEPAIITILGGGLDRPYNPNISELKLVTPSQVSLKFMGSYMPNSPKENEKYKLYRYPNGQQQQSINNIERSYFLPGTFLVDIPDSSKSYCFYVRRESTACGLFPESSAEICTLPLTSVVFFPYKYKLDWLRYPNILNGIYELPSRTYLNTKLQIQRIENGANNKIIPRSANSIAYTDSEIECKNRYCYRLQVNISGKVEFKNFSGVSVSNLICVDRSGIVPPKPSDIYVSTNEDNQNAVYFDSKPTWPLEINRWVLHKVENNKFIKIDSLKHPVSFVTDKKVVDAASTYSVTYVDKCESVSVISDSVTSVFLNYKYPKRLNWNLGQPFDKSGIGLYEVEYLDENSTGIVQVKPETKPLHEIDFKGYEEIAKFKIKVLPDNNSNEVSYSNTLKVDVPSDLYLPNVFTPNGDSVNDLWVLKGNSLNVKSCLVEVFNRFGETIVHFTDPKSSWDGKIQGKNAPAGVYYYKMKISLKNGESYSREGSLELMR